MNYYYYYYYYQWILLLVVPVLLTEVVFLSTIMAFRTSRRTRYHRSSGGMSTHTHWNMFPPQRRLFFSLPSDLYEHRCYYQPCLQKTSKKPSPAMNHPFLLVICIGMAQTIPQYQSHVMYLAQYRNVLLYQVEGLGLFYNKNNSTTSGTATSGTHNSSIGHPRSDLSLPYQAMQLRQAIRYFYDKHHSQYRAEERIDSSHNHTMMTAIDIDLVGFSLGGRIALAFIVQVFMHQNKYPLDPIITTTTTTIIRVHKVHLTGVSMRRSPCGTVQGMIWKDLLLLQNDNNSLRPFGWSILTAAYSPQFLYQNQPYLHQWVQSLCDSHTSDGILQLIKQTYDQENDSTNPWSVQNMIQQIQSLSLPNHDNNTTSTTTLQFRYMVGELDALALPEEVLKIVRALKNCTTSVIVHDVVVVPNVGHAVPMEASQIWRNDIQSLLDGEFRE